jgi:hypothetical protein
MDIEEKIIARRGSFEIAEIHRPTITQKNSK